MPSLWLSCFSLCPLPLMLQSCTAAKDLAPSSCWSPCTCWKLTIRFTWREESLLGRVSHPPTMLYAVVKVNYMAKKALSWGKWNICCWPGLKNWVRRICWCVSSPEGKGLNAYGLWHMETESPAVEKEERHGCFEHFWKCHNPHKNRFEESRWERSYIAADDLYIFNIFYHNICFAVSHITNCHTLQECIHDE